MRTISSGRPLPDLPGSSEQDLRQNTFYPFFRKTSRDVWQEAEIEHHVIQKKELCDHFFQYVKGGVECTKCYMGLEGHLDIKGGKLFFKGQQLLR